MRSRKPVVALCLATLAWLPTAGAVELFGIGSNGNKDAKLQVEFTGVEGALLENVKALSSLHRLSTSEELDAEMVGRLAQRAPGEARTALRPFGYYAPKVETELKEAEGAWKVHVDDRSRQSGLVGRAAGRDHRSGPRREIPARSARAVAAARPARD